MSKNSSFPLSFVYRVWTFHSKHLLPTISSQFTTAIPHKYPYNWHFITQLLRNVFLTALARVPLHTPLPSRRSSFFFTCPRTSFPVSLGEPRPQSYFIPFVFTSTLVYLLFFKHPHLTLLRTHPFSILFLIHLHTRSLVHVSHFHYETFRLLPQSRRYCQTAPLLTSYIYAFVIQPYLSTTFPSVHKRSSIPCLYHHASNHVRHQSLCAQLMHQHHQSIVLLLTVVMSLVKLWYGSVRLQIYYASSHLVRYYSWTPSSHSTFTSRHHPRWFEFF